MTFDRHVYIRRLRMAGVTAEVARAHADALHVALCGADASKSGEELQEFSPNTLHAAGDRLSRSIDDFGRRLTRAGAIGLAWLAALIVALKFGH